MTTFFMFGKYSPEAIKDISSNRTDKAIRLISELEGKIHSMYALLGSYDAVFIVDFPSEKVAMKASIGLAALTGIIFSTYPAITVESLDNLIGGI